MKIFIKLRHNGQVSRGANKLVTQAIKNKKIIMTESLNIYYKCNDQR